jgi:hypothetical protein
VFLGKERLTLYVMSSKNLVSQTQEVEKMGTCVSATETQTRMPGGFGRIYREKLTNTENCFVLSEDQKRIVEMVREIASKLGLEVEVVDVAKESAFHKAIKREPKIATYPTLVTGSGEKIEGELTREQVETFLASIH